MLTRKSFVLAISLIALACVASSAFARTLAARVGGAYSGADVACFKDYDSGMKNDCGTAKWYDIGLSFDTAGAKTIDVYTSNATACYYVEIDSTGAYSAPPMTLITTGHHSISVTVGFGNFGKVQCNIPAAGKIYGVDYNP